MYVFVFFNFFEKLEQHGNLWAMGQKAQCRCLKLLSSQGIECNTVDMRESVYIYIYTWQETYPKRPTST